MARRVTRDIIESSIAGNEGPQYPSSIPLAIMTLDDPALRQIVENFASDPSVIIARGVEREDRIEDTQQRAADTLAGVPPRYRYPCR